MNYTFYLQSRHWSEVKTRFWLSKYKKECSLCGRSDVLLEVHHKTYKNIGHEKLIDLLYLCRGCHELTHQYLKTYQGKHTNLWNAVRKLKGQVGLRKRSIRRLPKKIFIKIAQKKISKYSTKLYIKCTKPAGSPTRGQRKGIKPMGKAGTHYLA